MEPERSYSISLYYWPEVKKPSPWEAKTLQAPRRRSTWLKTFFWLTWPRWVINPHRLACATLCRMSLAQAVASLIWLIRSTGSRSSSLRAAQLSSCAALKTTPAPWPRTWGRPTSSLSPSLPKTWVSHLLLQTVAVADTVAVLYFRVNCNTIPIYEEIMLNKLLRIYTYYMTPYENEIKS